MSWSLRSVLALAAVGVAAAPVGAARRSAPQGPPRELAFSDRLHGVATFSAPRSCDAVATTDDGGRSWRLSRFHGCAQISSLAVHGPRAWAADHQGVWLSSDRGRSWRRVSRIGVARLSFASARSGWAMTDVKDRPRLFATEDGGRTWARSAIACAHDLFAFPARATSSHGWLLCVSLPGAGHQLKDVYETRDAARTWRRAGQLPSGGYGSGIAVRPSGRGWIWESRGWLYRTDDGGASWRRLPVTGPEYEAESVSFADDDAGAALFFDLRGRRYDLRSTRDGGATWKLVRSWPRS